VAKQQGIQLPFKTSSDKQKEAAKAWIDPAVTDIVYGGAKGGGKSYLGAALIFGSALMYPGTRYFIARKQLNDLRKHTIPTIDKVFEDWGIEQKRYLKFNGQDNTYHLNNGSTVLLIEAKYWPRDPMYERFGSMEFTRGFIEEAGEFDLPAKNNLSASIGRWKNDYYNLTRKLLQTGNPSKNYTYRDYYIPFRNGTLKPHQKFIQAFIQDNHMIDKGYFEQLDQSLSANEKQRLLYGNWEYDDDPAALIQYEKILDIFTNTHVPGGDRYITADIARFGSDRTVVMVWDGFRVVHIHTHKQKSLSETAEVIKRLQNQYQVPNSQTVADEDGVGGGVVDMLKCKGFVNNSTALRGENFSNLKSQCYYKMAEAMNAGSVFIYCNDISEKQTIIEELEQVKQHNMDKDGKRLYCQRKRLRKYWAGLRTIPMPS